MSMDSEGSDIRIFVFVLNTRQFIEKGKKKGG